MQREYEPPTWSVIVGACMWVVILLAIVVKCQSANARELVASFYLGTAAVGEGGPTMSNGGRYDRNAYTAAHRTLVFGTILHLCRGHQCVAVKITDRGPFVRGRDLDLSVAAAKALHMTGRGVAKVRVSTPLPRPRPDIIDEIAFQSEERRAMGF